MKVGVVGTGHLGKIHARIYSEIPGVDLVGVQDSDPLVASAVAEERGCLAFESLGELARNCDALSLCVPTFAHHELALEALESSCHILVEKPMARSVAEAEDMVRAASESGRQLMVGHVERFNPVMIEAMKYISQPGFVESHRLSTFVNRGIDVPVVLDLMIHDIDLLCMILDEEPESIDASGVSVLTGDIDIANVRLRFRGGCVANLTASRISRKRERKLRFFQADSYLSLDLMEGRMERVAKVEGFHEKVAAALLAPDLMANLNPEELVHAETLVPTPAEPLRLELEAFLESIRNGGPCPVDAKAGLRALRVAERILQEVRAGA
ncbi:MAG: Gfo/Idh/MocA family oxidoreductase [Candidatus Krumholzibacteria bacterium]|jgi:predicted dehydrogenase|nr:Gfo/Idh/MocA family oxidoreductase [Candidatus Krumholzibacteria bacterium]MDP6668862.1 Gfo/Idh/MocA family oxidoreductase [Candidatus Krumholzibacteria bacterium]MDP6796427.1 Gfo/Idh/MocA family oxidoreductase [Candidatus Krumholzibacteria bacterium]MDP7020816.1 Gfo/Idh/MocA family oxidoreductase [Candidatus Krumholzibacteria bacterium]